MTAHLTVTCICGWSTTADCPTVADIPTTEFEGWGYDERGFARCQACLSGGAVPVTLVAQQGDLFGRAT